jgi:hypothetical protein
VPLTLVRTAESEPVVADLEPTVDSRTPRREVGPPWDVVEEWGKQSFPASDPPANW